MALFMLSRSLPLLLILGCSSTQGTPPAASGSEPSKEDGPKTSDEPTPPATPQPATPVSDTDLSAASKSINAFSADIYGRIATTPGNLIMSPASMVIALGMTYQGATGATAAEFEKVLHLEQSGLPPEQWHAAMGELGARWTTSDDPSSEPNAQPKPELAVANRLFGSREVTFLKPFLESNQRDYRAPLEDIDFKASEEARAHINAWVEDRTRNRIEDLLPSGSIDEDTRLVLANALYFKAQWQNTFREEATKDGSFFADGTTKVKVPMMSQQENFKFAATDDATIIELPYTGGSHAMTLVVPKARDGLSALEASLTGDSVATWLAGAKYERIALTMPKFKVAPAKSYALSEELEALGMEKAFTDAAEFAKMADPAQARLKISNVFHKGFIEVDEKGTEAAAATAVVMMRAGGMPQEPTALVIDRPFLFFIRDTGTGATLFLGRVVDPR